jgi:hypothetical protein
VRSAAWSDRTKRFLELAHEDETSAATEFYYALEWLQTSHQILSGNYQELRAIPERFNTDRGLLGQANRSAQDALHFEFIRVLHNYLASVKTLVDHTRTFRSRHVQDSIFNKDCEAELAKLRENPVVKFLQEFRNPVLHSRLPRIALTTTFPEDRGLLRQLTVSVAELEALYDWSPEARRYISSAQEGYYEDKKYLDVGKAAGIYQQAVDAFYRWFYESIDIVKGALLAEFVARRTELAKLQAQIHDETK